MIEDVYDMLEEIEQGYDDDFKWVDQSFIASIRKQIDSGKELSKAQEGAIESIYRSGK